jgi:UDP-N-acetylmuramate--L-alanine ligase
LDSNSVEYIEGYSAENIENSGADCFIISAGEDENNPEVKCVLEKKLPYFSFSEFLYNLSKDHLRVVVTGTHGKSTTSSMLGYLFKNIDDSSFVAGAVLKDLLSNFHSGSGHYFIFEGDEYKALFNDPTPKFHLYKPDILLLTNLEYDHPDLFANLDETKNELAHLISNMPEDGLIIYNADNAYLTDLIYRTEIASFSFGMHNEADFKAFNIVFERNKTHFEVQRKGKDALEKYTISLPGEINVYNALGCIATLRALGFSQELIAPILEDYSGLKRRFEIIAEKNGVTVVDDYAHHPTAVKATIAAAKAAYPDSRIWAVFEPHTFSRTKALLSEFSECFSEADKVILAEIYPAREKVVEGNISTQILINAAVHKTPALVQNENLWLAKDKASALQILKKELQPGDVVIVMAVGDFNRLAYDLAEEL